MQPGTIEMEKQNPMPADQTVPVETPSQQQSCALKSLRKLRSIFSSIWSSPSAQRAIPAFVPETTAERLSRSTEIGSLDADERLSQKLLGRDRGVQEKLGYNDGQQTVLYLAYGSNLAAKTFLGKRGIRPLSQVNVYVPELRLTFDLPGIPYAEPCFAGTQFRNTTSGDTEDNNPECDSEKAPLVSQQDYHKDRWHKPLIGVVYEVTLKDYAHIIATEGGGRGYRDVVVTCYPFPKAYDSSDPVPDHPDTTPFKAHTLLSPSRDDDRDASNPLIRPDPSYAQPSARYLNLITTGAEEHNLPISYRTYLSTIRPYRITTFRQRVGQVVFLTLWGPLALLLMKLGSCLAGEDGRSPEWLVKVGDTVFAAMWMSYDGVFRGIFGDGERAIEDV